MSDPVARFLRIRPLALIGISATVGCLFGAYAGLSAWIWGIALSLCAILFAIRKEAVFLMLAVLFSFSVKTALMLPDSNCPVTEKARVQGIVTGEVVQKETHSLVVLRNVTVDGQKLGTRVRVSVYDTDVSLMAGDVLSYTGYTYRPSGSTNPGGFDYALWLKRRGIGLCSSCGTYSEIETESGFAWDTVPMRIRKALTEKIDAIFGDTAPVVRALVLSDKSEMDDNVYDSFRRAGLAHILAVSGLHISCLAAAVELLLRRLLALRRQWALAITTVLLLLYGAMIGFPASVVRAAVMYLALAAAPLSGRPSDSLTNISLAALLLLTVQPLFITDVGFQLSFLAVLGILCGTYFWKNDGIGLAQKALSLFVVGLSATLATLPVVANAYGSVSLLSPVTSIAAIPAVSAALPLSLIAVLTENVPFVGTAVAFAAKTLVRFVTLLSETVSELPFSSVRMPTWPAWLMLVYAAFALHMLPHFDLKWHARVVAGIGMALCIALCYPLAYYAIPDGFVVDVLDAGQADALSLTSDRHTYLVDVGKASTPTDEYLRYSMRTPEAIFLTHPDTDHTGGLSEVLDVCNVDTIYVPCTWDDFSHEEEVDRAMTGQNIVYLSRGDTIALEGGVTITVLQPEAGKTYADSNAASLVLLAQYGDASVLLTGDASMEEEEYLLPDADLLKVSHHGSKYNTSESTANAVTPSVSVISVGRNSYGHPAEEVISALTDAGSAVFRTDECGMIRVRVSLNGTLRVTTAKEEKTTS